ncbi:hypothetical protein [Gynuella sunshinyii]|uniref:Phenylalanyl-tRNA synthetase alpha subunit n=1 Tax=Gynuella sunshinyii YC6258 TaxID=1445510 RepID=A0A0C5VWR3_9GAMM|nr:hypothetical protein [Gynuella sunshinyii]AJQ94884.1 phenylalanyl-tRNA synthetase alpha subunit [Gynuella sunshinyii YC6258]
MSIVAISHTQLINALTLRDLTDTQQGPHAMQLLITEVQQALEQTWPCYLQRLNHNPVVRTTANYDDLGYPDDGPAREARYSRYLTDNLMLRTQTSSAIPAWLRGWSHGNHPDCLGALSHGLVYRRDSIDRWHTGEPHQLDVWLLLDRETCGQQDIVATAVNVIFNRVLPDCAITLSDSPHPYTENGLQIDARNPAGEIVEVGECGRISPALLARCGWDPEETTGIAMGIGLDRVLMLRKNIPDIRLLRHQDSRIQAQMQDLEPWQEVSFQPTIKRDLSLAVNEDINVEILGDLVRELLHDQGDLLEEVIIVSETPYLNLPNTAVERLGMRPGQKNVLLRLVMRHPTRSISNPEANLLRNQIYRALHQGQRHMMAE